MAHSLYAVAVILIAMAVAIAITKRTSLAVGAARALLILGQVALLAAVVSDVLG